MHEKLPEPADGEVYYRVRAKGKGFKPNAWNGYVLAANAHTAAEIIREGYPDLSLGIQGIQHVRVKTHVTEQSIERRIMDAFNPNEVVHRTDGGGVERIHRGMLREE